MSGPLLHPFVRFVMVGVLNTGMGLVLIFAAKALLGWGDFSANAFGYAVGLVMSFVLNRSWTFGHRGELSSTAVRFFVVFVAAYGLNLATVFALRDIGGVNSYLAQTVGVIPYTLLFYLASRYFVFTSNSIGGPSEQ